jgi:hypothetical protein
MPPFDDFKLHSDGESEQAGCPVSLLDLYCGSKQAGDEARETIRRRERADALRNRAMALTDRGESHVNAETRRLRVQILEVRREIAQLRAELPGRFSQQLAEELPDAHDFLHARAGVSRNGAQAHGG